MQVIVVDDCSDDDEQSSLLEALDTALTSEFHPLSAVVRNTARRYDSGTRNACMAFAEGEFIVFVDSDNVPKPNLVRHNY